MREKIGIIGFGNMGRAIGERLKEKYQIYVFDKDKNKTKNLSGLNVAVDVADLVKIAQTLILAVKPQDFDIVLDGIKDGVQDKLIISIAAGISSGYIEKRLGKARVIRAMPNLPIKVGKGMTCLSKGRYAFSEDFNFAKELFNYLGKTMSIEENLMHAATAISGSGPGFHSALLKDKKKEEWESYSKNVFIPKLSKAAQGLGFSTEQATVLASSTTQGNLALLSITGLDPETLCIQVTSKGGTTEAGLKALQDNDKNLEEAVKAAVERSAELSKRE